MSRMRALLHCCTVLGIVLGTAAGYLAGDLASLSTVADTVPGIVVGMLLSVVVGGAVTITVSCLGALVERVSSKAFRVVALLVGALLVSLGVGFLIGSLATAMVSRPGMVGPLGILCIFGCLIDVALDGQIDSHVRKRVRR